MKQSYKEILEYLDELPDVKGADKLYFFSKEIREEDVLVLLGIQLPEKGLGKRVPDPDEGLRNLDNRPYSVGAAKDIGRAILDGEFLLTGETAIISDRASVLDSQHRWGGVLWATNWWRKAVADGTVLDKYPHWGDTQPYIDICIVAGIPHNNQVANKINTGRSRSNSDIVYRDYKFSEHFGKKDRKELAKLVAPAIRLVWGRMGGKLIRNTPKLDQRENMTFLNDHPGIVALVEFVYTLDADEGNPGGVKRLVPPSVIAGLGYLMSTAKTPPGTGRNDPTTLDYSLMDDAKLFIQQLASGANLKAGDPVLVLRNALGDFKGKASGSRERDDRIACIIKAWNAWIDGKRKGFTLADLKPKAGELPRIGGLDSLIEMD